MFRSAPISLLFFALPATLALGQNSPELSAYVEGSTLMVRAAMPEEGDPRPLFQALWRGVDQGDPAFTFQPTAAPRPGLSLPLDQLLEAALGAYLDAQIRFERQGVTASRDVSTMLRDMDAIVRRAAEFHGAEDHFAGFSPAVREQLDRLSRIDWSKATFGIDGGDEQDKYLAIYYYVRVQREELERLMREDIAALATVDLLAPATADPGTTLAIGSICGTVFDEDNYLCALDLTLADTGGGGIEPALGREYLQALEERRAAERIEELPSFKPRKRDRWLKAELDRINERIDRTDQRQELWVLRDRLDDIDARMDDLQMELGEVKRGTSTDDDNPIANLSALTGRNITVHFGRGGVQIAPEYRVLLNEVFEQLARAPKDKVLITGYSDRSGDPAVNLRLSEQRAKAVRDYLLRRGIASERLMVNYYGDSRSTTRNPEERRVEVEWLR